MTRISIPAKGDSASFYFKGRLAQPVAIAATLGTAAASQDEVITPAQPARQGTPGQKGP